MANYEYNTTKGVVVPDTSEVKQQVQEEFQNALGQDLDLSDSTPQGRLIEAETIARKRTIENMALISNMLNPNQSYGAFLDSIASLFGVERIGATRTRVSCTLSGTANTVIPQNAQARDTNGNTYYLENSVTIGTEGTSTGDFLCMEKGAIECPANTLTEIVTAVLGWNSINNASDGETGLNGESDNELRQKLPTKQYQGRAIVESIKSAILAVDGVQSCFVKDNPDNTSTIIVNSRNAGRNITLPAHSLYVCVDGGEIEKVAQAIYDTRSVGCAYASSNNEVVIRLEEQEEEVIFSDKVYFDNLTSGGYTVPIYVAITVKTGSTSDLTEAIKSAIQDYANNKIEGVDGLQLGVSVSSFEIACAVNTQIPELFVQSVKVGLSSGSETADSIFIGVNEKATISADHITIVVNQR